LGVLEHGEHRACSARWEQRSEFIEKFNVVAAQVPPGRRHWMLPDGSTISDSELRHIWRRVQPGMTMGDVARTMGFGFDRVSAAATGVLYSTSTPLYLLVDPASGQVVRKHDLWRVEELDASVAFGGRYEGQHPTGRTELREFIAHHKRQVVVEDVPSPEALNIPFEGEDYCALIWDRSRRQLSVHSADVARGALQHAMRPFGSGL
jgi:hypothetical protein